MNPPETKANRKPDFYMSSEMLKSIFEEIETPGNSMAAAEANDTLRNQLLHLSRAAETVQGNLEKIMEDAEGNLGVDALEAEKAINGLTTLHDDIREANKFLDMVDGAIADYELFEERGDDPIAWAEFVH